MHHFNNFLKKIKIKLKFYKRFWGIFFNAKQLKTNMKLIEKLFKLKKASINWLLIRSTHKCHIWVKAQMNLLNPVLDRKLWPAEYIEWVVIFSLSGENENSALHTAAAVAAVQLKVRTSTAYDHGSILGQSNIQKSVL